MLGFRVSVEAPLPPTMYAGPLEFRNGGGMPTVRHTKDDGSWRLHSSWTGSFDPDHDKVRRNFSLVFFCFVYPRVRSLSLCLSRKQTSLGAREHETCARSTP